MLGQSINMCFLKDKGKKDKKNIIAAVEGMLRASSSLRGPQLR
jgi:hypothetical protein